MTFRQRARLAVWSFCARRIVTPFLPYILSDAFLASEVDKYGLRGLNRGSINLQEPASWPAGECPVVFVQVDQLEEFASEILPQISASFVLLTGKWQLPGLELTAAVELILKNPFLKRWYSQNQIHAHLPIFPLPYGVELSATPHVYWRMKLQKILGWARSGLFIPNFRIHPHLHGPALEARRDLAAVMAPRLRLADYLNEILKHQAVISPAGDRCDTYRHWESVALGAIPVSNLPEIFSGLFGETMLLVSNFRDLEGLNEDLTRCKPKPELALVRYWRRQVSRSV